VFILPYIEQQALFNAWNSYGNNTIKALDQNFRYAGPVNTTVTTAQINVYTCPSDPNAGARNPGNGVRYHNYAVNYGNTDQAQSTAYALPSPSNPNLSARFSGAPFTDMGSPNIDDPNYAAGFVTIATTRIASITDGLSNTLLASELVIPNPGKDLRGYTWWGPSTSFNAILTPNSRFPDAMGNGGCSASGTTRVNPPCNTGYTVSGAKSKEIYLGARSKHAGGVNAAMCDGSVRFVKDSINPVTWMGVSTTQGGEVLSSTAL
jgi:prepilin-type processing-associated H-X9-DG protein